MTKKSDTELEEWLLQFLPDRDPYEYLMERKFPDYEDVNYRTYPPGPLGISPQDRKERREKFESYRAELKAKPSREIRALCEKEVEKERQARAAIVEGDEQSRFFNQPGATADFEHWSKAANWTLDEAVALVFGKAPEVVKREQVWDYVGISPFATQYVRVHDLARRAMASRQLVDPVQPSIFLAWARGIEIEVPGGLIEHLEKRGIVIADWKDRNDNLKLEHDKLNREVALSEVTDDNALSLSERGSLLKMVLGMAIAKYDYDGEASRNTATGSNSGSIAADLESVGLTLSPDTIRKFIKMAEEEFGDLTSKP